MQSMMSIFGVMFKMSSRAAVFLTLMQKAHAWKEQLRDPHSLVQRYGPDFLPSKMCHGLGYRLRHKKIKSAKDIGSILPRQGNSRDAILYDFCVDLHDLITMQFEDPNPARLKIAAAHLYGQYVGYRIDEDVLFDDQLVKLEHVFDVLPAVQNDNEHYDDLALLAIHDLFRFGLQMFPGSLPNRYC